MKPVSSIIRRSDGLRTYDACFRNVKTGKGQKTRIAESRLRRLRPYDSVRPLNKGEQELLHAWSLLGKATLSRRTYRLLVTICAQTTAAPLRVARPTPRLTSSPTDIRPWLCDPSAISDLFHQLKKFDAEMPKDKRLCEASDDSITYDPWFLHRSGEKIPLGENEIASMVWERVAGFTHRLSYSELRRIEHAYLRHMQEPGWPELVDIILGHTKGETGLNWLRLFASLPISKRREEVEFWMMQYPDLTHCPGALVYLAKPALMLDMSKARALHYLWHGLNDGAESDQLCNGIYLWKQFKWTYFPRTYPGGTVDVESLIRLTKLLTTRENHGRIAHETWQAMHQQPVLQESFDALSDEPYGHRGWLFFILRDARYAERDDALCESFNHDFAEVSRILLGIAPEYREKASYYFVYAYWDRSAKLSAADLMRHIAMLCSKPFTTTSDGEALWCKLVSVLDANELPISSWKRIDSASRSRNQSNSIENGLDLLNYPLLRPLLKSAMNCRVRLCLELLRLAGQSASAQVKRAYELFQQHPLIDVSLKQSTDLETFGHLVGESKDLRIWKKHLTGEKKIRTESAERIYQELEGSRIEILLQYLKEEITPPVSESDDLQLHTRLYANAADENRRAYRKLIRRYSSNGESGILFHPSNQYWLRTHRFVRQGIWLTGLRAEIVLTDGKRVFLEMERRFEQVLKMGTLVNSCLALDGCNSHSALANAADVNKQVVMAYDEDQKFIGRQLVGIAEERRLVCFDVYGQRSQELMPAFAAFDNQLEKLMALPIHREGEYQLKPLVCREWYDDYSWQPPEQSDAKIIDMQWGGSRGTA
ncbi:hypothetical protein [Oceaniferula spumae]|uniref:hypothetical protein n=1 Tax=Oceaniferula spumae TaxID=2979115 RepID=UPI003F4E8DCD